MQILLKIARAIDGINEWLGRFACGCMLVMTAIGAYNAIARSLGRVIGRSLSSNRYIEAQWYLFSLIFLFGAGYLLKENGHVRVDILYARLSARGKAWVNLFGALLLLLPVCGVIVGYFFPAARNSLQILEQSSDPNGLPRYPLKIAALVAFCFLGLQGLSQAIAQVAILTGTESPERS